MTKRLVISGTPRRDDGEKKLDYRKRKGQHRREQVRIRSLDAFLRNMNGG